MSYHTVISTVVKSELGKAWPQLWRKAYDTKAFIPNLEKLEIHEKTDDLVLRTMSIGQTIIKERIIADQHSHTVYFHNIEGSHVKGLIYNRLYVGPNDQLILEFGSNASHASSSLFPPTDIFLKTLEGTKRVIQENSN